MLEIILEFAAKIDAAHWGPWTKIFIAAVAAFLTLKSRFFQFRKIRMVLSNTVGSIFSQSGVQGKGRMTPFQAAAMASTVGMGNIVGVATALSIGGLGAIFWMWGVVEVFVDTIVICTITSFAILSTGVLSGGESGIDLVIQAFSSVFPSGISGTFISLAILTFCLTTQIGFFIYNQTAASDLFGRRAIKFLKWIYLISGIIFAGVANVDRLWALANISVGLCTLPNRVALLALNGIFFVLMKDFLSKRNEYACKNFERRKELPGRDGGRLLNSGHKSSTYCCA